VGQTLTGLGIDFAIVEMEIAVINIEIIKRIPKTQTERGTGIELVIHK